MGFKDLYNHILLGVATTALVTVISGASTSIVPLSKSSIAEAMHQPSISLLNFKLAPQCKILTKFFEIPRCQATSSATSQTDLPETTRRLH